VEKQRAEMIEMMWEFGVSKRKEMKFQQDIPNPCLYHHRLHKHTSFSHLALRQSQNLSDNGKLIRKGMRADCQSKYENTPLIVIIFRLWMI
jgi:hypothetical protein